VCELIFNEELSLVDWWDFFRFKWVFLLILSRSCKFSSWDYFNDKTCSFRKFVFNWVTRLINASHVIEINCTLVMITRSSDLNLMNKQACLCSSLYNESWCFRMLKWVENIHIIWSERCDAFAYCWVTSMSQFIKFSIKFRRKLIKLNHVCWAVNIVSSWSNQSFFDSLFR